MPRRRMMTGSKPKTLMLTNMYNAYCDLGFTPQIGHEYVCVFAQINEFKETDPLKTASLFACGGRWWGNIGWRLSCPTEVGNARFYYDDPTTSYNQYIGMRVIHEIRIQATSAIVKSGIPNVWIFSNPKRTTEILSNKAAIALVQDIYNGEIIRSFVPKLNGNTWCFYDEINDVYKYTNQGYFSPIYL